MKILIAVDGSEFTQRMLGYLTTHGELFGPQQQYTVLTAVPAVPARAAAVIDKQTLTEYYADEAEKVLAPVRTFLEGRGLKAETSFHVGHPADVISKTAAAGSFDLVVMGSHGHSALGNLVLGSVATNVLANCKTPVLLVR
ncbi:universal stress protein [Caldimonas brevitalea]|uniref:Universal stress protein UspA n=1 Tax=Caldimonas brevitalea TaxID=413882 RepID=A0A0G3BRX0_9BURK|nr:universal stress protein [Caldimonas brevitalea]AKJ32167.1 universal stress protein UspA [Caldimonas brevitalea]